MIAAIILCEEANRKLFFFPAFKLTPSARYSILGDRSTLTKISCSEKIVLIVVRWQIEPVVSFFFLPSTCKYQRLLTVWSCEFQVFPESLTLKVNLRSWNAKLSKPDSARLTGIFVIMTCACSLGRPDGLWDRRPWRWSGRTFLSTSNSASPLPHSHSSLISLYSSFVGFPTSHPLLILKRIKSNIVSSPILVTSSFFLFSLSSPVYFLVSPGPEGNKGPLIISVNLSSPSCPEVDP